MFLCAADLVEPLSPHSQPITPPRRTIIVAGHQHLRAIYELFNNPDDRGKIEILFNAENRERIDTRLIAERFGLQNGLTREQVFSAHQDLRTLLNVYLSNFDLGNRDLGETPFQNFLQLVKNTLACAHMRRLQG